MFSKSCFRVSGRRSDRCDAGASQGRFDAPEREHKAPVGRAGRAPLRRQRPSTMLRHRLRPVSWHWRSSNSLKRHRTSPDGLLDGIRRRRCRFVAGSPRSTRAGAVAMSFGCRRDRGSRRRFRFPRFGSPARRPARARRPIFEQLDVVGAQIVCRPSTMSLAQPEKISQRSSRPWTQPGVDSQAIGQKSIQVVGRRHRGSPCYVLGAFLGVNLFCSENNFKT